MRRVLLCIAVWAIASVPVWAAKSSIALDLFALTQGAIGIESEGVVSENAAAVGSFSQLHLVQSGVLLSGSGFSAGMRFYPMRVPLFGLWFGAQWGFLIASADTPDDYITIYGSGLVAEVGHKWAWPSGFMLDLRGGFGNVRGTASGLYWSMPVSVPLAGVSLAMGYQF